MSARIPEALSGAGGTVFQRKINLVHRGPYCAFQNNLSKRV